MKNKKYKKIAILILVIGIIFIFYALNHPEASFPWSNNITYIILHSLPSSNCLFCKQKKLKYKVPNYYKSLGLLTLL